MFIVNVFQLIEDSAHQLFDPSFNYSNHFDIWTDNGTEQYFVFIGK